MIRSAGGASKPYDQVQGPWGLRDTRVAKHLVVGSSAVSGELGDGGRGKLERGIVNIKIDALCTMQHHRYS